MLLERPCERQPVSFFVVSQPVPTFSNVSKILCYNRFTKVSKKCNKIDCKTEVSFGGQKRMFRGQKHTKDLQKAASSVFHSFRKFKSFRFFECIKDIELK